MCFSTSKNVLGIPGGPLVKAIASNAGDYVRSLVGKLKSHMPHKGAKKNVFKVSFDWSAGSPRSPALAVMDSLGTLVSLVLLVQ